MKIEYLSVGLLALFSPLAAAWSKEGMFVLLLLLCFTPNLSYMS
jgi:hypothetical protein